jgi:lipoprotein signal peptidase
MQAARGTPLTGPAVARESGPPDRPEKSADTRTAPRRVGVLVVIALMVLAVDIATKVTVVATLSGRVPVSLLGGLLKLGVWRNPGAAFSIGPSMTLVFSAIAVGVIVYILRTSRRIRSLAWALALGLLLGGATGNLTDRIFRSPAPLRGFVVDWIQVPHWPVFNVADSSIVCGGILAVLLAARGIGIDGRRIDGRRSRNEPAGASAGSDADDQDPARSSAEGPSRPPSREPRQPSDGQGSAPGSGGA